MITFEHCTFEAENLQEKGAGRGLWSAESEFHEVFTAAGDLFAIVVEDPNGPLFLVHFSQHTIAGIVNASRYDYNPATKATRKTNNEAKGLAASRFGGLLHLAMEAGIGDKSRGRKELKIVLAFLMRLRGLDGKWDGSTFDAIWTIVAAGHYESHVDSRVRRCGEVIARGLNEVDTLVLRLFLGMTYWNMLLTAYGTLTNHKRLSPIEVPPNVPHEAWDGGICPPGGSGTDVTEPTAGTAGAAGELTLTFIQALGSNAVVWTRFYGTRSTGTAGGVSVTRNCRRNHIGKPKTSKEERFTGRAIGNLQVLLLHVTTNSMETGT